jgi:hypothetical protein
MQALSWWGGGPPYHTFLLHLWVKWVHQTHIHHEKSFKEFICLLFPTMKMDGEQQYRHGMLPLFSMCGVNFAQIFFLRCLLEMQNIRMGNITTFAMYEVVRVHLKSEFTCSPHTPSAVSSALLQKNVCCIFHLSTNDIRSSVNSFVPRSVGQ